MGFSGEMDPSPQTPCWAEWTAESETPGGRERNFTHLGTLPCSVLSSVGRGHTVRKGEA